VVDNKMYIANGQDPEHFTGYAHFYCVDVTKKGDISGELPNPDAPAPKPGQELVQPQGAVKPKGVKNPNSGVVWEFYEQKPTNGGKTPEQDRMHRSICTVAVADGLVFVPDFSGYLHCLDAKTGRQYWAHNLDAQVWGSPLVADGKVYVVDGNGMVSIFEVGKEKKLIAQHDMGTSVFGTPVFANGTLFILSMQRLFAIQEGKGTAAGARNVTTPATPVTASVIPGSSHFGLWSGAGLAAAAVLVVAAGARKRSHARATR
jgi:outer membrane protein assembly factor BamB